MRAATRFGPHRVSYRREGFLSRLTNPFQSQGRPPKVALFAHEVTQMMKRLSVAVVLVLSGALLGTVATRSSLQGQQPLAPPATPKELTSYRDIVKGVLPAVVSIESKVKPAAGAPARGSQRRRSRTQSEPRIPEE